MIFQTCIGDYIDKNNNSEIIILGIISMMKTFTVSKNGKINEIFKENYKTCLDQQEKEITTLQKKIQTFDATTTNFRNKAFTVYNKIVNKIK